MQKMAAADRQKQQIAAANFTDDQKGIQRIGAQYKNPQQIDKEYICKTKNII